MYFYGMCLGILELFGFFRRDKFSRSFFARTKETKTDLKLQVIEDFYHLYFTTYRKKRKKSPGAVMTLYAKQGSSQGF